MRGGNEHKVLNNREKGKTKLSHRLVLFNFLTSWDWKLVGVPIIQRERRNQSFGIRFLLPSLSLSLSISFLPSKLVLRLRSGKRYNGQADKGWKHGRSKLTGMIHFHRFPLNSFHRSEILMVEWRDDQRPTSGHSSFIQVKLTSIRAI